MRKLLTFMCSLLFLLVLAMPAQAANFSIDPQYEHVGEGKLAGFLNIYWKTSDPNIEQISIQVEANNAFSEIPIKTIQTGGQTQGVCVISINWADRSNYNQRAPNNTAFNIVASDGVEEIRKTGTVGPTTTRSNENEETQTAQQTRLTQDQDEGGWVDKMLAAPINGAVKALRALGLKDLDVLLFNKGVENYFIPPFISQNAWHNIAKWFNVFYYAAFGLILLGLFYTGAKIIFTAYTPKKREQAMKSLSRFLYAFVIIIAAPLMIRLFIEINNAGVEMIAGVTENMGLLNQFQADSEGAGGSFITNLYTGHVLTTAIVRLALVTLMIYFNILYLIRALVLAGLLALTPILIWLWAMTDNETAIKIWFGEITSVTFMQFLHAFSLLFFLTFTNSLNLWWATVVALFMVIPFTNVLRNIFQGFLRFLGINEEGLAAGGMGMIGGLAAMGRATLRPGAGISGNSSYSPIPSGSVTGSSSSPFGVINAPTSPQAQGSLATLSKISPVISKVGSVVGTGVGMAMAIPLVGVNPGLASTVGTMGKNITQGAIGLAGRGVALGGMTAGNILKAGSVSKGIKDTATLQIPIDPEQYPGYAGMTHETKAPESTSHAALGLLGATFSSNPIQGYEKGQNVYKASSAAIDTAKQFGNRLADPSQWKNDENAGTNNLTISPNPRTTMNTQLNTGNRDSEPMQWRT